MHPCCARTIGGSDWYFQGSITNMECKHRLGLSFSYTNEYVVIIVSEIEAS
jgi:hypothetical protein